MPLIRAGAWPASWIPITSLPLHACVPPARLLRRASFPLAGVCCRHRGLADGSTELRPVEPNVVALVSPVAPRAEPAVGRPTLAAEHPTIATLPSRTKVAGGAIASFRSPTGK